MFSSVVQVVINREVYEKLCLIIEVYILLRILGFGDFTDSDFYLSHLYNNNIWKHHLKIDRYHHNYRVYWRQ